MVPLDVRPMMKPQLFCYTCAGGTGAFFDTIEKDLPEMQLVKPDYPGHGSRRKEPFCSVLPGNLICDENFCDFSAISLRLPGNMI